MKYSHLFMAVNLAVSSLFVAGCDNKNQDAATVQQMPPPVVNVISVKFQNVPLLTEFAGRTAASKEAQVRPEASGTIEKILFNEGGFVKQGQPLYKISTENYGASQAASLAAVQQAEANVDTAQASYQNAVSNIGAQQAQLDQAISDYNKLKQLVNIEAISKQQFEQAATRVETLQASLASARASAQQAQANIKSSKAAVATAKANLSNSQLNLSRTIVRAPISGQTTRSNVTAGTLVTANQPNPLMTITQINPIYVDISQSSADLLKIKQQVAEGSIKQTNPAVQLRLEDGTTYNERGRLLLREASVDKNTGGVTLRAVFANDKGILIPGMFVTANIIQGVIKNAVLVPQSAMIRTPKGDTQVYIVDKDNKIQVRPVKVKGTYKNDWVVTDGLKPGEKLVAVGGANVKPEQEVKVKPYVANQKGINTTAPKKTSNAGNEANKKGSPEIAPDKPNPKTEADSPSP